MLKYPSAVVAFGMKHIVLVLRIHKQTICLFYGNKIIFYLVGINDDVDRGRKAEKKMGYFYQNFPPQGFIP